MKVRTDPSNLPLKSSNFNKVQPRLYSESNTRGNAIAWLAKPQWSDTAAVWSLSIAQKRAVFGQSNMPLPGGQCPVEHEKEPKGKDSDIVAAFWHESPAALAAEVAHYLCAKSIVDLTPGSGHWALWAVKKRIPYTGITMTEVHRDLLMKRLVTKTIEGMIDPNDEDLYDAAYTSLVEKKQPAQPETAAPTTPATKPKTPKPKTTTKHPKPAASADKEQGPDGAGGTTREDLMKKIIEASAKQDNAA